MLLGLFAVLGLVLFGALADLQAIRPERLRLLGQDQRLRTVPIDGYRGAVLDRGGFVLAMSARAHRVVADPTMVPEPAVTAALLAPALGLDPAALTDLLTPDDPRNRYELLVRDIDDAVVAQLDALRSQQADAFTGVFVLADERRVNPAGRLGANLVGRTDIDEAGVSGIELMYDDVLQGSDGSETFEGGRYGSISVGERVVRPADTGTDVVLTIDHRLQYVVDQALIEQCEAVGAKGANAAISDPRTGELLALSSVVRDDTGSCVVPSSNRALVDTFEPGSVLKLVTMAAAIEQLGVGLDSPVPVRRSIRIGDKTFAGNGKLPPGDYPLWQVFAESSNVGTIGLAERLGPEVLHDYLARFGFGAPTGIGFKGESTGSLRPPEDWWGSDLGSIAIGQGVTVNVVQLLAAYNTVANDGIDIPPTLVRSGVDDGGPDAAATPGAQRVISEEAARQLRQMLTRVVSDGTGAAAAVAGYDVAGKTGTAWKAVADADGAFGYEDEGGDRRYLVTFAGFVPADDPQLSMVVVVDEPQTETTASEVAAPVFARIAQYALRILAIPPTDVAGVTSDELVRGTPAPAPAGGGTRPDDAEGGGELAAVTGGAGGASP